MQKLLWMHPFSTGRLPEAALTSVYFVSPSSSGRIPIHSRASCESVHPGRHHFPEHLELTELHWTLWRGQHEASKTPLDLWMEIFFSPLPPSFNIVSHFLSCLLWLQSQVSWSLLLLTLGKRPGMFANAIVADVQTNSSRLWKIHCYVLFSINVKIIQRKLDL